MTQAIRFNMHLSGELIQKLEQTTGVVKVVHYADSVYIYHNFTQGEKSSFLNNFRNLMLVEDLGTV